MLQQVHCYYFKKTDFLYLFFNCGFKLVEFGNYSINHMYGIFKISRNVNDYSNFNFRDGLLQTKRILLKRYLKSYKILNILFNKKR